MYRNVEEALEIAYRPRRNLCFHLKKKS